MIDFNLLKTYWYYFKNCNNFTVKDKQVTLNVVQKLTNMKKTLLVALEECAYISVQ